jgi:hypothetical protein
MNRSRIIAEFGNLMTDWWSRRPHFFIPINLVILKCSDNSRKICWCTHNLPLVHKEK